MQKGVNKFTDLTKEEFDARYHTAMLGYTAPKITPIVSQPIMSLGESSKWWEWLNPWSDENKKDRKKKDNDKKKNYEDLII